MIYCVAMKLEEGLVFVSDSRTNAGVDNIAIFRKLHLFAVPDARFIAIQSAGNLATSQAVISLLRQRLAGEQPNLYDVATLNDAALLLGQTLREVLQRDVPGLPGGQGVDLNCSLLLGGEIAGAEPELFNIYPQGNFISATVDTPFFQIGESKYGKPILDRAFDSTTRSNLSVGLPLDLVILRRDRLTRIASYRIDEHDVYFQEIRRRWGEGLRDLLGSLPAPPAHYWT